MAATQTPLQAILMNIVTGKYRAGDRLVERNLVPDLGVSRTPVREAIRKLEGLGLVRSVPQKGAVVAELSPADAESLYFLRVHIERLAAGLSFYNIDKDDLEELRRINRELRQCPKKQANLFEMIERDRQFHQTIYRASKNRFLIEVIDELRLRCYVIAYYAWTNPGRIKASVDEHREIIKSLKQKDRLRFEGLIEHQLTSAKLFYLEAMR